MGVIMWPVEMAAPNDLRRGDVVLRDGDGQRGVVVCDPGGSRGFATTSRDVTVSLSTSTTVVTDNHSRAWRVLAEREQTTVERVRSFLLTWSPETAGDETFTWHLMYVLMSPDAALEATSGIYEWPDDGGMALALARHLDSRMGSRLS